MPVCKCGQKIIIVAGVAYSRHLESGKHWAALRKQNGYKPRSKLLSELTALFGKERAKALLPTLKGKTDDEKILDAIGRQHE